MTGSSLRAHRASWAGTWLLLSAVTACGSAQPNPTTPATSAPAPERDAVIAQLERDRDDAEHRARDAKQEASTARGECALVQHELDTLRERQSFEQTVWSRLEQAEVTERALRENLAGASRDQRRTLESALKDAETAHDFIEHSVRRVYVATDVEWARFRHDLDSALDGLDRTMRKIR